MSRHACADVTFFCCIFVSQPRDLCRLIDSFYLVFLTKTLFLHTATPTSMIFAQESDMNQLHVLKDCTNHALGHELVPIVTSVNESPTTVILPEMLDNLPQLTSMQPCIMTQVLTGVYTLPEEPELEAEENTSM